MRRSQEENGAQKNTLLGERGTSGTEEKHERVKLPFGKHRLQSEEAASRVLVFTYQSIVR